MKLSVEGKVAAVIGAGFLALTTLTIAQGNNEGGRSAPDDNAYSPRNNPRVNTQRIEQEYNSALQPTLRVDAITL
jgi:hypothetical protein